MKMSFKMPAILSHLDVLTTVVDIITFSLYENNDGLIYTESNIVNHFDGDSNI